MKRKHFLFTILFFIVANLFAIELIPTEQLLLSYLENDLELQKLTLAAEKSDLSYKSTKIDTGINVNLSTGNISFKTSENGLSVKAVPSVKMSIPQASNLSLSAQGNLSPTNKEKPISDTSISLGIDIISSTSLSNKINEITAERNREIAIRNLEQKAIEKEKAFYTELKNLLNSLNSIIQSQKKLYNDMKDFESVKARGFSKSSSTYRTSELQLLSDKNTIETQIKSFINQYILFYKKCGLNITLPYGTNFMDLIPTDIPNVTPVKVEDFNKEKFIEIENAHWNYELNNLKRQLNKNFTLSANAGYTFGNSLTNSDTVNLGITSTIGGLNLQGGVNIPITSEPYPSFTISAGVNPNTFRKNNIKSEQDDLTVEQELLDIQIAENNYENFLTSAKQNLEELLWKQETTNKNYEMYEDLEKDMKAWYKEGVVSESEYLSALTNLNMYKLKIIMNQIDFIIYNDDINRKFIIETNK